MTVIESIAAEELRVDEAWWRIYDDSFPPHEREPRDVILESVLRRVGMAIRARRDGVTSGLATTHLLKDPAAVFLVYLAVARTERNRGLGAELLEGAWKAGADRLRTEGLQPLGLVWEVDPPQVAAGAEAGERQRRIAFFQRRGGKLLQRSYVQPPVDGIAAVPMRLMLRPTEGEEPPKETVDALVREMYFEKYGAINGIDRSILEGLLTDR